MEPNHWRGDYNGEINGGRTKWDRAELRNPTGKTIGGLWGGGGDNGSGGIKALRTPPIIENEGKKSEAKRS